MQTKRLYKQQTQTKLVYKPFFIVRYILRLDIRRERNKIIMYRLCRTILYIKPEQLP